MGGGWSDIKNEPMEILDFQVIHFNVFKSPDNLLCFAVYYWASIIAYWIGVDQAGAICIRLVQHHRLVIRKLTIKLCDRLSCVFAEQPKPLGSCHKHAIPIIGSDMVYNNMNHNDNHIVTTQVSDEKNICICSVNIWSDAYSH